MPTMLAREEIDALVRGMHPDPFAVLGPHDTDSGLVIRVFRPHVRGVELVRAADHRAASFTRAQADVLYEIVLADDTREDFDYRLRLIWPDGSATEIDDPY